MVVQSLYEFRSYKQYLAHQIALNSETYGYQTQLSEAAGCQRSFLSQVLHGKPHLTAEHMVGLAKFWRFTREERAFLLNLQAYEKAGEGELAQIYAQALDEAQADHLSLAQRLKKSKPTAAEEAAVYYSSWLNTAAQLAITLPDCRNIRAVARRLGCSEDDARDALIALQKLGLAEKRNSEYRALAKDLHLPNDSPFITIHRRNWRDKAVENSGRRRTDAIHYTSLCTLSKTDFAKLGEKIRGWLTETRAFALQSPEEELVCFNVDYFRVTTQ